MKKIIRQVAVMVAPLLIKMFTEEFSKYAEKRKLSGLYLTIYSGEESGKFGVDVINYPPENFRENAPGKELVSCLPISTKLVSKIGSFLK